MRKARARRLRKVRFGNFLAMTTRCLPVFDAALVSSSVHTSPNTHHTIQHLSGLAARLVSWKKAEVVRSEAIGSESSPPGHSSVVGVAAPESEKVHRTLPTQ